MARVPLRKLTALTPVQDERKMLDLAGGGGNSNVLVPGRGSIIRVLTTLAMSKGEHQGIKKNWEKRGGEALIFEARLYGMCNLWHGIVWQGGSCLP